MAENKHAMGDDPLAWLTDDKSSDSPARVVQQATVEKADTLQQLESPQSDTALVEESFAGMADKGHQIVTDFYHHLFEHHPTLKPLFEGISSDGQQKKLLAALVLLVNNLRRPEVLEDYLKGLGQRHQSYGVVAEDYQKVISSLLVVLEKHAGEQWTPTVATAWRHTLQTVAETMLNAYDSTDEKAIPPIKLEKFNHYVRHDADYASQVHQLAADASDKAEKGGATLHNAAEAISAISASNHKAAEISEEVDEIAFRLDLLALNAIVEAARLGGQGRGIAVLAAELRKLTQRSASALSEIKTLVSDNSDKLKQSAVLVDESSLTLKALVEDSKKMGDIVADIMAANSQQSGTSADNPRSDKTE